MRKIVGAMACTLLATAAPAQTYGYRAPAAPAPIFAPPGTAESFGDWTVEGENGAALAHTANQANSIFGVLCGGKGPCQGFFNPHLPCDEDHQYPALINSPAGSFAPVLTCHRFEKDYMLVFPIDKTLLDSLSIGGVIGIAFPMKSGEFDVARFSLTGSLRAVARAAALAGEGGGNGGTPGLGDSRL